MEEGDVQGWELLFFNLKNEEVKLKSFSLVKDVIKLNGNYPRFSVLSFFFPIRGKFCA